MNYKKWSEMTAMEKRDAKWKAKGRPHLLWVSLSKGTYMPNHNPEHYKFTTAVTEKWTAPDLK